MEHSWNDSSREGRSQWFDLNRLRCESWINAVTFRRECRSTNDLALTAAPSGAQVPHLFLTDCQTGGRGRGHHRWWAGHGALTFSVMFAPSMFQIGPQKIAQSSPVVALAVGDALSRFVPSAGLQLKWPNDVWFLGRKICGILIEPVTGMPDRLIAGIGINVLNSLQDAPDDLRSIATSLVDETGSQPEMTDVLLQVLGHVQANLQALGSDRHELERRWAERCALTGRMISLQSGDREVTGLCCGIDSGGGLLVQSDGVTRAWFGGIVRCLS